MKKSVIRTAALFLVIFMSLGILAGCAAGEAPERAFVDSEGNIVVVFADGSENVLGKIEPAKTGDITTAEEDPSTSPGTGEVTTAEETAPETSPVTEPPVTLLRVYVNEEKHAVAEYSDGHIEDLGYVGVEVEPPIYTVRFLDASGRELSSEQLYRGRSATAPAAPQVADKIFSGWDVDFTNVQSDLTVRPVYTDMASHTVTFLDASGNVIKTETVIDGRSATAPAAPKLDGKIFNGWDTSFASVKSDLTVKPLFRDKGTFTVQFNDYSGLSLGSASVTEGDAAKAPANPTREGYTFTGWSPAVNSVTKNLTAVAQYRFNGGSNVIDVSYALAANNTVKVTFTIKGTVKFAGCDIEVKIPAGLTYKSLEAGNGVVANQSGSSIFFSVANSTNITSETKLATVTFGYTANEATFDVKVSELFDQNQANVAYSVVGKKIKMK